MFLAGSYSEIWGCLFYSVNELLRKGTTTTPNLNRDRCIKPLESLLSAGEAMTLSTYTMTKGDPRDLDVPITLDEVKKAVGKLKNGKSNGPDNTPNELIKAWHPDMNTAYAEVINQSFSTGVHIPSIGQGILTPLQKPGKPKGPVKSIRPLMLLNGARKILSLIAHDRICDKLDRYTGATQAAYKRGRSCADLIWTQRMLVSVVKNHHWEFSKMGVDMSAAFDTIVSEYILETLELAGCCEDDIRIIRYLLSNTKLQVKINQMLSGVFGSTLGSLQGYSISGILFTAMFARAKKEAREEIRTREILGLIDEDDEEDATIEDVEDEEVEEETLSCDLNDNVQMPDEWAYADDGDYINEEMSVLESMYNLFGGQGNSKRR